MGDLTLLVIAAALLWIGWELHRLVNELREFLGGLGEGYEESIEKAKQGN